MRTKKITALIMAAVMATSVLGGCGSGKGKSTETTRNEDGSVDLEIWTGNSGFQAVEKDGAVYNFYKELTGVGITQPYVEWNGGSTFQQQLNLKISAGEMPDMFTVLNGMENNLIKSGVLLDLTDLLPEKAPHLWETIPEEVWNAVKANDPTGEGRIYVIPNVVDYSRMCGLIRQDWLDNLGLDMPSTYDEFVEVLKAFKTEDPNGNGVADEIPTGGRQEVKWMDYLFSMYGIAMWEGAPQWDIYDGELTYSAVTTNMKDALASIRDLYEQGLIDPETLLNDKSTWEGKINSDKVGVAYQWAEVAYEWAEATKNATGVEPDWAVLPVISAPGYEGFYTAKKMLDGGLVVKNTDDEELIDEYMKVLDAYGNQDLWKQMYYGVEGMHYEMVDGKEVKLPDDKSHMENLTLAPYMDISTADFKISTFEEMATEDRAWAMNQSIRNIEENQQYGKTIAGDGIPSSIYDEYPDIMNRTLYVEYASKIITGEYDIDKFDEFVEKWYATGGEAVTKAAREWYSKTLEE